MEFEAHGAAVLGATDAQQNMPSAAEIEAGADVDEPPDMIMSPASQEFQKSAVRKANCHASLLTKALHHDDDHDDEFLAHPVMLASLRRRSMTSNFSLASTADLTSDTGFTSPSRTNTPSPPLPETRHVQLHELTVQKSVAPETSTPKVEAPLDSEVAPRKRCITFACAANPSAKAAEPLILRPTPMIKAPSAQETRRQPSIKFACQAPRPASTQNTPPRRSPLALVTPEKVCRSPRDGGVSPARKLRSRPQLLRSSKENRSPKMVAMDSVDLENDSAQFHEFACDKIRDDDWVRHEREDTTTVKQKITINDTLVKENHFRQIAKEAEEEAEAEENEDEAEGGYEEDDEDDDDDDVESNNEDEDEDDEVETEYGSDIEEGYHTDEETGFAESDEEGDSDLEFWTPRSQKPTLGHHLPAPTSRRSSIGEHQSDSSTGTNHSVRAARLGKARRVPGRSVTPELPDSTDFVCGTLDEDRPMEEAYLSCIAARKAHKRHIIPQDIDPSFPASDPEDEDAEERFNPVHHDSDDDDVWLHGKMDDLHHDQERAGRKKNKGQYSPKRLHSPPPKPPKPRGRSPKQGHTSPRRMRSPAPKMFTSARTCASPTQPALNLAFAGLGTRVGLTQTKSLPRPSAMFPQARHGKKVKATAMPQHKRGAIDIVKGLESKRMRRKEKFFQKYCNRARKGQVAERKPLPGHGAERMKELGLLMAGKSNTKGNYVLSV